MPERPTQVVGQRVGAFLIDSLVNALLTAIAWLALTDRLDAEGSSGGGVVIDHTRYAFTSSGNRAIWVTLVAVFTLAIFVVLPGLRGTSPGRAVVGIRVVGADGRPPGVGRALVRWVVWMVVDNFPYLIPGLVGFIVALTSKGNQRVGDMAAATWVVHRDAAGRPIAELLAAAQPAAAWQPPGQPAAAWQPPGQPAGAWQPPAQPSQPPPPPSQPAPPPPGQPAGWYPDPHGQARLRWWDGAAWTENVSN